MTCRTSVAGLTALLIGLAGSAAAQADGASYHAGLSPLNADAAGSEAGGEVTLTVADGSLTIHVEATGTPPGVMHLQHFHGFPDGDERSRCPTPESDANDDGVIDLIETEPRAGITMVPFHDDPASLEIATDTYPTAGPDGAYSYQQTVPLDALTEAFSAAYPGQQLDLDRRVVFLHGVAGTTDLPDSAASLGDIPAQVTLPIACGEISRSEG